MRFVDKAWSVKRRTGAWRRRCRRSLGFGFAHTPPAEINDAEGNPLLKLRCNLATIQGHVIAEDAEGKELFDVQGKFKRA